MRDAFIQIGDHTTVLKNNNARNKERNMITINVQILRAMDPRRSRFDGNFLVHYPNFNGTWSEFLELDKISYDDKIWVARRVLNRNKLTHFAVLCAQSVLSIYENKYPDDKRVSDLISFMITIADFSNLSNEQQTKLRELRSAAYAAYAADAAATAAAARKVQQELNISFLKIVEDL